VNSKGLIVFAVGSVTACSLACTLRAQNAATTFAVHDGDRVAFYGDSITEQREYTQDVENYVLTRFPSWKVNFHNAGVGGDRVSGGWAGPINLRLDRDVFDWHPDVITVMLGMNDFYSRPDQPGIYSTYVEGLRHIVDALQAQNPHLRITLIQPSAYDDVTREPLFPGGSNGVLLKYGEFVAQLARERRTDVADFNSPLTAALKTLNAKSPALAKELIPDRVHPGQGGHWIMAESLLECWNAPSVVASVTLNADMKLSPSVLNANVTDLTRSKNTTRISWTETDLALPLPFPPSEVDPVLGLVIRNSDLIKALDDEMLKVLSLPTGSYDLLIDSQKVGSFTADQLADGINLATLETPMLKQARLVAFDTEKVNDLESTRFNSINESSTAEQSPTAQALADAYLRAVDRQRTDAQPVPHRFELIVENPPAISH
jgi:lysophospholipase L1-like esterase